MANSKIIKGGDLMLFDSTGKSYAFATNHTLTITAETTDTSSKDHGMWNSIEISKYSWEITSENLFTQDGYSAMFDKMIGGTEVTVVFGTKTDVQGKNVADGDLANWSLNTTGGFYKGSAYITSLTANANNGENATYSITLTGKGKIEKATTLAAS